MAAVFEDTFSDSVDEEAIILDTRFNGVGIGKTYMRAKPRGWPLGSIPSGCGADAPPGQP